ncbi:MAG TPA: MASE3 domain-containing protein [Bacteroidales bacterium]|nr:MASE3 domain-containing protein [Bacteroidales bacterium]
MIHHRIPSATLNLIINLLLGLFSLVVLYVISLYNYLLFHTLVELYSIVIAFAFFSVTWNSKAYMENNYLVLIGIAYLFVGALDMLQTLTYPGLNIISGYEYYANQFWVAARYVEALSFLFAFIAFKYHFKMNYLLIILGYTVLTLLLAFSILFWHVFPVCFNPLTGLTTFKIVSEYIISGILLVNIVLLAVNKSWFSLNVYRYLMLSLITTIAAEVCFTFYATNFDYMNMLGHFFKLISFFMIYKAIVETGLRQPFQLLFKELKESEMQLSELNATKDKFFSIIAHDLRNPFNALNGLSDMLLKKYDVFEREKNLKMIREINVASKRGYSLLENLLEWTRSQSGRMEWQPEPIELNLLCREVIDLMISKANLKDLELNLAAPDNIEVIADSNMVKTILRNLISNAIKFSEFGAKININVQSNREFAKIAVEDHGMGIPEDKISSLFRIDESFIRTGTNKEHGTGLGLVLSHEFAEKNGGRLWVESEPGNGSTFFFTLPLDK